MSDFPSSQLPLFVHPYTVWGCGPQAITCANVSAIAVQTWVANLAVYMPVTLPWAYPVNRVFWMNGSAVTGNVDFGIYTASGSKVYSTGSTAQAGATAPQFVTPTVPFTLPAGRYFFAYVNSSTTSVAYGTTCTAPLGGLAGLLTQATALPLPSPATFATNAGLVIQLAGITRTPVGSAF